tara:strand:- start:1795 stop:2010 length:216 start_codon:yes stop_codon:yes gene_type:complete
MEDKEIEEIISRKKEPTNKELFKLMVKINSRVKQLYQQTYNPPTNNDLNKSINDLSERINIIERRVKEALK